MVGAVHDRVVRGCGHFGRRTYRGLRVLRRAAGLTFRRGTGLSCTPAFRGQCHGDDTRTTADWQSSASSWSATAICTTGPMHMGPCESLVWGDVHRFFPVVFCKLAADMEARPTIPRLSHSSFPQALSTFCVQIISYFLLFCFPSQQSHRRSLAICLCLAVPLFYNSRR